MGAPALAPRQPWRRSLARSRAAREQRLRSTEALRGALRLQREGGAAPGARVVAPLLAARQSGAAPAAGASRLSAAGVGSAGEGRERAAPRASRRSPPAAAAAEAAARAQLAAALAARGGGRGRGARRRDAARGRPRRARRHAAIRKMFAVYLVQFLLYLSHY
jgi:hypothetical protein